MELHSFVVHRSQANGSAITVDDLPMGADNSMLAAFSNACGICNIQEGMDCCTGQGQVNLYHGTFFSNDQFKLKPTIA